MVKKHHNDEPFTPNDKRHKNVKKTGASTRRLATSKQENRYARTNTLSKGWSKPLGLLPNVPLQVPPTPVMEPIRKRPREEQRKYHNVYYHEVRKRKTMDPVDGLDDDGGGEDDNSETNRTTKRQRIHTSGKIDLHYKTNVRKRQRAENCRGSRYAIRLRP